MTKLNPKFIYLLIGGVSSLASMTCFSVTMVYQVTVMGLNPLQLVLVGTVLEVSVLLFEVPTGVVADVYSRRLSMIIGLFIVGLGMAMFAIPNFWLFIFAQVVWGLGYTFTSGATDAWLVDEVGSDHAGAVFLRASSVNQVCGLIGIGCGVLLSTFSLQLPMILSGAAFALLGVFLIFTMPEHHFTPAPREGRNSWQTMWHTFSGGLALIRQQPILLSLIGVDFLHGLFSEGYDRLWQAHLINSFEAPVLLGLTLVAWFGFASALGRLFSMSLTEMIRRRFDLNNQAVSARALFVLNLLLILCLLAFPIIPNFYVALLMTVLIGGFRSAQAPVHSNWLNQRITDSQARATVLSMNGQMDAIGQIAGGPAIGVVGNLFSTRAALLISASILSPILALLKWSDGQVQAENNLPPRVPGE